jgi:hypothetical protein
VLDGDDVLVAGGGDEDAGLSFRVFHGHDLVAFHRRLQRADRIDPGHEFRLEMQTNLKCIVLLNILCECWLMPRIKLNDGLGDESS